MHRFYLLILGFLLGLSVLDGFAQESVPKPESSRFPNVRASLDDGFFVLAEQLSRGVLRSDPKEEERREVVLLLTHALWGQKRYTEMLDLIGAEGGGVEFVYWRARAHFELREYDTALNILNGAGESILESRYAPSILRLKGHIEHLLGRLKDAETTFVTFAKSFPKHAFIVANQFDLAAVYTKQKRISEALMLYEVLAEGKGKNASERAQLKIGNLLYTHGAAEYYEKARGVLTALATNAQVRLAFRIDAYVDLAALEEKDNHVVEAISAMRKGISLSPDAVQRVPLKLALARVFLRSNDTTSALKLLEECRAEAPNETVAAELQLEKAKALLQAELYDDAEAAFQVYLDVANDPEGLAQAYFGKGMALWGMKLGRYAEAAGIFDKVQQSAASADMKARALFKSGDSNYKAGRFEEAEKRYRTFVSMYPDHEKVPDALYQQGLSLARIGTRDEALAVFALLEEKYPQSTVAENAALRTADVLLASQDAEAALQKYASIVQTFTNRATAALGQHQQGLVLWKLQRYEDALKAFEAVNDEFAESEYAPQASYMRGFCLYRLGQFEDAVKTCEAFVSNYPESEWAPEVIFWLAEQYFNQGVYVEAESLFWRVGNDFKGNRLAPRALYWAGRSAAAQSNYVKAVERYSEVAKLYSDSDVLPQARFAQGDALTELGEFARAILAFEEIIKNYPENDLVNAAWGRKGDCQFTLGTENPQRYLEAMNSFQSILDRPSAPMSLKLQSEYKIGRCFEMTHVLNKAFSRYMNAVYTFINESEERSSYGIRWFTRSAIAAGALKEKEKAWVDAVNVYERVIEANVPAKEWAIEQIKRIKNDNWLLFQKAEESNDVGTDG